MGISTTTTTTTTTSTTAAASAAEVASGSDDSPVVSEYTKWMDGASDVAPTEAQEPHAASDEADPEDDGHEEADSTPSSADVSAASKSVTDLLVEFVGRM